MFLSPKFISTGSTSMICARCVMKCCARFPAVERDFSFVFGDGVEFEKIRQSVTGLCIAELRSFVPVEIFRGEQVGAGKYSILMRAKLQSSERTLRDDEVAKWAGQIAKALEALGGAQRA
jgi:phenylalanyl-tRNA synthetase beta chain